MVMLGAFLEITNLFADEVIKVELKKLLGESKQNLLDVNMEAISSGRSYIKQIRGE